MNGHILAIDQSTQGTKAFVFDETGKALSRADAPHQQIISAAGWVSHDPEEIFQNVLKTARLAIEKAGIDPAAIACIGISNQRETTVAWNADTGKPVCDAVVWQCARAADICAEIAKAGFAETVQARTGIPLSPYFPAAKLAWILRNVPEAARLARNGKLRVGTVDAWLLWKLTGRYLTDFSNASRTQLFNIHTLSWDEELCAAFGVRADSLPRVVDSDAAFGETTLGGLLARPVPVRAALGDSHAALLGQNCQTPGMTKATYGTGSSIMMNIGERPVRSQSGLATSLAWKARGRVLYVMEGNLHYTGAVVSWLKDSLGLIADARETEALACAASPTDTSYLVPAFTGLGAPHWRDDAKALLCGMTRVTGRAELARAALDCIAYQIHDVLCVMEKDVGVRIPVLLADGGATRNAYLMQFQADILNRPVAVPEAGEMSAVGAAYMAGIAAGVLDETAFDGLAARRYAPDMQEDIRVEKLSGWRDALRRTLL